MHRFELYHASERARVSIQCLLISDKRLTIVKK